MKCGLGSTLYCESKSSISINYSTEPISQKEHSDSSNSAKYGIKKSSRFLDSSEVNSFYLGTKRKGSSSKKLLRLFL